MYVLKKTGIKEEFDSEKVVKALSKSAKRVMYTFTDEEKDLIRKRVYELAIDKNLQE